MNFEIISEITEIEISLWVGRFVSSRGCAERMVLVAAEG
jgi:hypothetical protein